MKLIKLFLLILIFSGCGQTRYYNPQRDSDIEARLAGFRIDQTIEEFNAYIGCDIWKLTRNGATIEYVPSLPGKTIGKEFSISGKIQLDKTKLLNYSKTIARLVLLHELGHGLGYGHNDSYCNVMQSSAVHCDPSMIPDFLDQIKRDQFCL